MTADATEILEGLDTLEAIRESHPAGTKVEPLIDRLYDELERIQDRQGRRARLRAAALAQVAA